MNFSLQPERERDTPKIRMERQTKTKAMRKRNLKKRMKEEIKMKQFDSSSNIASFAIFRWLYASLGTTITLISM